MKAEDTLLNNTELAECQKISWAVDENTQRVTLAQARKTLQSCRDKLGKIAFLLDEE